MRELKVLQRLIAFAFGLAALMLSGWALADPPARVARLGYVAGTASLSPAGEDEWVQATLNRPLVTGDRLWSDTDGRAELQLANASVRMGASTSLSVLDIGDRAVQLELSQGTLNVRLRTLASGETFEIDTPNLAFSLRKAGEYRIDVDSAGTATMVSVRSGQGDVYGEGAAYVVNARQSYRFSGTGLRDFERVDIAASDEFDRWCAERDRRVAQSTSRRYVSPYVVGYEDLDSYGTWRTVSGYGRAWVPTRVAADWAPYRNGHWTWIEPWGWTWVDDAPWGYAVSHYGRWAHANGAWCWVPGPIAARPVYAPALVAFVGGPNFQLAISSGNVGGVAWFPLGPREIYQPAYAVSRGYFHDVNTTNTIVTPAIVDTYYNSPNAARIAYVNRQVPNAVVAVPATAFAQAQPVARAAVRVPRERIADAPVNAVAAVAPTRASLGAERKAARKPPEAALDRAVVARTAPPARLASFERREQLLAKNPGRPLDAAATKDLASNAGAQRGKVKVVAADRTGPVTNVPPPSSARKEAREKGERRQSAVTAAGQPPATAPVPNVAPARAASDPSVTRGKPDRATQADVSARAARDGAVASQAGPRQSAAVQAKPAPLPHASRGKGEQRDRAGAVPPAVAATPAAAPAPQASKHARAEPRAKPERHAAAPAGPAPAAPAQAVNAPPRQKHADKRAAPVASAAPPAQRHAEARPAPMVNAAPPAQKHAPKHAEPRGAPAAAAASPPAPKHAERPPQFASAAPPQPQAAPHGGEPKPDKHADKPAGGGDKKHGK